jgi:hypothetical protein
MTTIDLPSSARPAAVRQLMRAGLMAALALTSVLAAMQFDVSKECAGGAFSSAFSSGFDVRHCDMVVKRIGGDEIVKIPLPRQL